MAEPSSVVVVESPAKAKTINKYLGKNYTVLASYGHIRDLPAKDGSVDPNNDFKMVWEVDPKAQKRLKDIADALKGADQGRVVVRGDVLDRHARGALEVSGHQAEHALEASDVLVGDPADAEDLSALAGVAGRGALAPGEREYGEEGGQQGPAEAGGAGEPHGLADDRVHRWVRIMGRSACGLEAREAPT